MEFIYNLTVLFTCYKVQFSLVSVQGQGALRYSPVTGKVCTWFSRIPKIPLMDLPYKQCSFRTHTSRVSFSVVRTRNGDGSQAWSLGSAISLDGAGMLARAGVQVALVVR